MYHYLKWAAFSLFLKRNLRYLILILVSLIGIYGSDAVYRDLVDYFVAIGRRENLLFLLICKWIVVFSLCVLLIISIMRLGFGREVKQPEKKSRKKQQVGKVPEEDLIMDRLEKFRNKKRLKRKSDHLMERFEREKKRHG